MKNLVLLPGFFKCYFNLQESENSCFESFRTGRISYAIILKHDTGLLLIAYLFTTSKLDVFKLREEFDFFFFTVDPYKFRTAYTIHALKDIGS